MEVDRSQASRSFNMAQIICCRCGRKGHFARDCQAKVAVAREEIINSIMNILESEPEQEGFMIDPPMEEHDQSAWMDEGFPKDDD